MESSYLGHGGFPRSDKEVCVSVLADSLLLSATCPVHHLFMCQTNGLPYHELWTKEAQEVKIPQQLLHSTHWNQANYWETHKKFLQGIGWNATQLVKGNSSWQTRQWQAHIEAAKLAKVITLWDLAIPQESCVCLLRLPVSDVCAVCWTSGFCYFTFFPRKQRF